MEQKTLVEEIHTIKYKYMSQKQLEECLRHPEDFDDYEWEAIKENLKKYEQSEIKMM